MKRRQFLAVMAGAAVAASTDIAAGLSAPVTSFASGDVGLGAYTVITLMTVERIEDGSWRHVITETIRRVRGPDG